MAKIPKLPVVSKEQQRTKKIDDMYRAIEASIFMHVDDQPDTIYMASLLLTTAKNIFVQFLSIDRTIEILEMVLQDLKSGKIHVKS